MEIVNLIGVLKNYPEEFRVRIFDPEYLIKERGFELVSTTKKTSVLTKGIVKLELSSMGNVSIFLWCKIINLCFGDDDLVYSGIIRNGSEFDRILQLTLGIEV